VYPQAKKNLKQLPQVYLQESKTVKKKRFSNKSSRVPSQKKVSKKSSKEGRSSVPFKKKTSFKYFFTTPLFSSFDPYFDRDFTEIQK
jgi:hypothetical protein